MARPSIRVIPQNTGIIIASAVVDGYNHNGVVLEIETQPFMILPTLDMAEFFARQLDRVRESSVREAHQLLQDVFGIKDESNRTHVIMGLKGESVHNTGSLN
jgi:hypothetical protein